MNTRRRRSKTGGRSGRLSQRAKTKVDAPAYITRKVPVYEAASEEVLALIETNAETLLEEIGIDFRDDAGALQLFKTAGATIDGERVRFPRGMCREIIQQTAPSEFTQHARNSTRNVVIGGDHMVLAPAYGSPYVRDLDKGRRYATIEDF